MDELYLRIAKKVPKQVRKFILEEDLIGRAVNVEQTRTPMEYLFDAYETFIDNSSEHDNWQCAKCRAHVLNQWKTLKPYMEQLSNENIKHHNSS